MRRDALAADERVDTHRHRSHQLTLTGDAVISVGVGKALWVLPRGRGLWVPAGVPHDVSARGATTLTALYFEPISCPIVWREPTVVSASGLAGHLMDHLATELEPAARRRAQAVLFDLLRPLTTARLEVPKPIDARAREMEAALRANPADGRTLAEWGRHVGASGRTLARVLERDTGMGFAEWRTRLRMAEALALLADGCSLAVAGQKVGYAGPSAFVAAFRRVTGTTPGEYFSTATT